MLRDLPLVVALNKIDVLSDPQEVQRVREEVRATLRLPPEQELAAVSALKGTGCEDLLGKCVDEFGPPPG